MVWRGTDIVSEDRIMLALVLKVGLGIGLPTVERTKAQPTPTRTCVVQVGDSTQIGRTLHKLALVEDKFEDDSQTRVEMGEAVRLFSKIGVGMMIVSVIVMMTKPEGTQWLEVALFL